MFKVSKNIVLIAVTFFISFFLGSILAKFSPDKTPQQIRVAVVDMDRIINESEQVNSVLKVKNEKMASLQKLMEKANNEVMAEKDSKKRNAIEKKYTKQINQKKSIIDEEYSKNLSTSNENLNNIIREKIKKYNLTLVLDKDSVIYGGVDITDEIMKELAPLGKINSN